MEKYHPVIVPGLVGGNDYKINFPDIIQMYISGGPKERRIIRESIDPIAIDLGNLMMASGDIAYLKINGFVKSCNMDGSSLTPEEETADTKRQVENVGIYRDAMQQLIELKREILKIDSQGIVV